MSKTQLKSLEDIKKESNSIELSAREYTNIKQQIKELETLKKPHYEFLFDEAIAGPIDLDEFKISVSEFNQRSFSFKDAEKELGVKRLNELLAALPSELKQFVKTSARQRLNVKDKK